MTRLLPTVFQLDAAMVDVLDDVARGLGVSRSHVARAYLEEALRSRLLWPPTGERHSTEPAPAAVPVAPAAERVPARASASRRRR
jgi:hypothetical protein